MIHGADTLFTRFESDGDAVPAISWMATRCRALCCASIVVFGLTNIEDFLTFFGDERGFAIDIGNGTQVTKYLRQPCSDLVDVAHWAFLCLLLATLITRNVVNCVAPRKSRWHSWASQWAFDAFHDVIPSVVAYV